MRPAVAWMPANLDACAMYRQFMPHLHYPGSVFLYHQYGLQPDKFAHCQIAMVQRMSSQSNYEAMKLFKRMGMKTVYDLDDDMWSVPTYNPAYKPLKIWLPGFNICAVEADLITVSTEHLKVMVRKELGKKCPPVEVVENAMDFDWFKPVPEKYRKQKNGRVAVGWAGTNTHDGDIGKVFGLLPQLLEELPQMDFELVGMKVPEDLKKFGDRVKQRDFVPVAEYASHWASWQWDVALAPLQENTFNLSKSNIKMLEAAAVGIPCVASRLGEYKAFCAGSSLLKEAVMADSLRDWKRKIAALVTDENYRKRVGQEMLRVGKERFDIVKQVDRWVDVFTGVVEG